MKRQHPYSPKCQCTRCKAVKKLVDWPLQKLGMKRGSLRMIIAK